MVEAAPVFTNIPVSTPAANIRIMAGEISIIPDIISVTVFCNPHPDSNPPINAPKIRLYTGDTFLTINIIDKVSPNIAANALFISYFISSLNYSYLFSV